MSFAFVILSFLGNLYNQATFIDRLELITVLPAVLFSSYVSFFSKHKEKDFSKISDRINESYSSMLIMLAIASCIYFDLGLLVDVLNVGFSSLGLKYYFLFYQAGMGGAIGGFLIPDLFDYVSKIRMR